MSLYATWSEFSAGLPDASLGLVLIVKWTAVLTLAWLAHGMLAGRNPRWRVAIWRSAVVGLALVTVLSMAPPIVAYQSVSRDQASMERAANGSDHAPPSRAKGLPRSSSSRSRSVPCRPLFPRW